MTLSMSGATTSLSFSYLLIIKRKRGKQEVKHPDISHHHKITSWAKVEAQCDFIITKATEGEGFVDPTLKTIVKECEKRKIPYWVYVFLKKGNERKQTEFMVKKCKAIVGKYFQGYVLDIESGNKEENCIEALRYLKKQCDKQMIYTMYAQYGSYKNLIKTRGSNCAWWEARYGKNNGLDTSAEYPCHSAVDLHQYTSAGKVDGITGDIDLNKIKGKGISFFTGKKATKTYDGKLPDLPARGFFKAGDKGVQVIRCQRFLIWAGFDVGHCGADGIYGKETQKAVLSYKKKVGLNPNDGNFGQKCLAHAKTFKK